MSGPRPGCPGSSLRVGTTQSLVAAASKHGAEHATRGAVARLRYGWHLSH